MDSQRKHTPDPYLDPDGSGLDIYRQLLGIDPPLKRDLDPGELLASVFFFAFTIMLLFLV